MTIKTISFDEQEILNNIIKLHVVGGFFADVTYGRGKFYKGGVVAEPELKFDLNPRFDFVQKAAAENLYMFENESVPSIVFDPPFVAGHTTNKSTGIIGEKYYGFPYVRDLWGWYTRCINEFSRVIQANGWLVFKCQDTVSADMQYISHAYIIAEAEKAGFYCKDVFILLAKNRLIGHNHKHTQKHARKFHSYFIVFQKKSVAKTKILNRSAN